jgi:hypothetical protein
MIRLSVPENLTPNVLMMQSAQNRNRHDIAVCRRRNSGASLHNDK